QRGDLDGEREGAHAAVFLPAVLRRARAAPGDIGGSTADHLRHALEPIQRVLLAEPSREQDREAHLVELYAAPERRAVREVILAPTAILMLRRDEVGEHLPRTADLADRGQCEPGLDSVARPDQVIAAAAVAAVAPGDAEARHHRARKTAPAMDAQHSGGEISLVAQRLGRVRNLESLGPELP